MNLIKNKKLLAYSTFASSLLTNQSVAHGQVIYTDIDPDIVLEVDEETAGVDMDNNGTHDFGFLNSVGTFYKVSFGSIYQFGLWAGPEDELNLIAAWKTIEYVGSSSFAKYYPFALQDSDTIDENKSFQNWGYQKMAFRSFYTDFGDLFNQGGEWFPDVENHFLGVRFIDSDDCYHYGWIRCSVTDSGRVLTINDYAYEEQCDNPILAGDTTHFTALTEMQSLETVIYSFDENVYVQFNETPQAASIHLYDLTGKVVYSNLSPDLTNIISLEGYAAGIYVVEVITGDKKMVKKALVE